MNVLVSSSIDWKRIRLDNDYLVDYLKSGGLTEYRHIFGVKAGKVLLEYLLSLSNEPSRLQEEKVRGHLAKISAREFCYAGGYSTVHIDSNGHLMNFHNRLKAMLMSGVTFTINVHTGIDPHIRNVFRAGETKWVPMPVERFVPPVKKEPEYVMKYPYRIIALIMAYDGGTLEAQTDNSIRGKGKITNKQATEWCKKNDNPLLFTCVGNRKGTWFHRISDKFLSPAEWQALRYITARVNPNDSSVFFTMLKSNEPLDASHPITSLRNAFTGSVAWNDKRASSRMRMVIQAWNAFRKGEKGQIAWDMISDYPKAE